MATNQRSSIRVATVDVYLDEPESKAKLIITILDQQTEIAYKFHVSGDSTVELCTAVVDALTFYDVDHCFFNYLGLSGVVYEMLTKEDQKPCLLSAKVSKSKRMFTVPAVPQKS